MWKACLYCGGPYTLLCSVLLFILFGMLQSESWTFEVLTATHGWDAKEKARCCRNAAVLYLFASLIMMLLAAVDTFVFNLSHIGDSVSRMRLSQRYRRNGLRATMQGCCHELKRLFGRGRADVTMGAAHDTYGEAHEMSAGAVNQASSFSSLSVPRNVEQEGLRRESVTATAETRAAARAGSGPSLDFVGAPRSPAVIRSASLLFRSALASSQTSQAVVVPLQGDSGGPEK